ncbi:transcriptional intermediary factor 1 alpha [Naegleria gruberi]|uniref:Transcriptional intermediary factor 1 alpha n=1 Tax=Naegleria gruberi TaxID=5762 RepID=D2VVC5_NAEGR|nr:transcriptional intermediary factor 1 alpha [Naegleria gruberi]EFC39286.1 transcriptional intermediary factor 1 alpha [Naegleria gruberi]|eukprot:XP_002672030.1 transcriptional intermediary factor 1 alpha [Naegleria gruberi strain NEG-M]
MLVIDEESLSCKFCFELLQDPRVLPCGHSMCTRCIMANINFKKLKLKEPFLQAPVLGNQTKINKLYGTTSDQSNKKEGICFNCPSCNKECKVNHSEDVPSVFPINYDLKSTVENYMMEREKGETCANCETNIVQVECEDCNSRFCEECFTSIHAPKFFASHKKAPLGTILTVGKCKRHNNHTCVPIDEHMEEAKAGMSNKIEQVDQDIEFLYVALEKIGSLQTKLVSNQETYEMRVNTMIDNYLAQVEDKRKEILDKSQSEHQERMAIVQDQYSTMSGLIENMQGIKNAFEKVIHFRNITSLITAEHQIESTLQDLNCKQLDTSPIFFTQKHNPSNLDFKETTISKAVSQLVFDYPLDIKFNICKECISAKPTPEEEPKEEASLAPSLSSSVPKQPESIVQFEKSFSNIVAESLKDEVPLLMKEDDDEYNVPTTKKKKIRVKRR